MRKNLLACLGLVVSITTCCSFHEKTKQEEEYIKQSKSLFSKMDLAWSNNLALHNLESSRQYGVIGGVLDNPEIYPETHYDVQYSNTLFGLNIKQVKMDDMFDFGTIYFISYSNKDVEVRLGSRLTENAFRHNEYDASIDVLISGEKITDEVVRQKMLYSSHAVIDSFIAEQYKMIANSHSAE